MKLDITWLVDAVNVSEAGSYGKVGRDWRQGFVDIEDILRLGVKGVIVDILIVYTIFFAASDTDFLGYNVS
jgi:hypothetical protein